MMRNFKATLLLTLLLQSYTYSETSAQVDHYYAYVACESDDEVHLIHFDSETVTIAQRIPVGEWPSEIEGPHGVTVSPDGNYWFVTMAHGNPYGKIYKYETSTNRIVGQTELGLFPATMELSHSTGLLYAANFNLHGDMLPGTVSIVDPGSMIELTQTTTGIMPHGSRLSPDGLRHYSVSMMDNRLHEIDAVTFELLRSLDLQEALARMSGDTNV
ncbi:MAG: YncE family protein, partial [Rhodothermales bacterium]|nr:YncE family protein [Rhodothermales bacterium]